MRGQRRLPFVGRPAELGILRAAFNACQAGRGALVLVDGEAGIGKTRLCKEALASAQGEGAMVCWADCLAATRRVPYSAVSALLRSALDRANPTPLAGVASGLEALDAVLHLEDARQPPVQLPPEARLADSVSEFFRRLAGRGPLVVFVDSVELLDEASARVLAVLADRLAGRKTLILLSGRDVRATPGVQRLWAQCIRSGAAVIRLKRLDEADAVRLVSRAGHALPDAEIARLVQDAHGLPLWPARSLAPPCLAQACQARYGRWWRKRWQGTPRELETWSSCLLFPRAGDSSRKCSQRHSLPGTKTHSTYSGVLGTSPSPSCGQGVQNAWHSGTLPSQRSCLNLSEGNAAQACGTIS